MKRIKNTNHRKNWALFTTCTFFGLTAVGAGIGSVEILLPKEPSRTSQIKFSFSNRTMDYHKDDVVHVKVVGAKDSVLTFATLPDAVANILKIVDVENNYKNEIECNLKFKNNISFLSWDTTSFAVPIKDRDTVLYSPDSIKILEKSSSTSGGNYLDNDSTTPILLSCSSTPLITILNNDGEVISPNTLQQFYGVNIAVINDSYLKINVIPNAPHRQSINFRINIKYTSTQQWMDISYVNSIPSSFLEVAPNGILTGRSSLWTSDSDVAAYDTFILSSAIKKVNSFAFAGSLSTPDNIKTLIFKDCDDCSLGQRSFAQSFFENILFFNSKNISIGDESFMLCTSLKQVDLTSVASINQYSFTACTSLEQVVLPPNFVIPRYAFAGCSSLQNLDWNQISSVGAFAFANCNSLTSLTLDGVPVATSAFSACQKLSSIQISNIASLGSYSFDLCSSLAEVTLSNIGTISEGAFEADSSIIKLNLDHIDSIGSYAFFYCNALEELFMENFTSILPEAFESCSGLKKVELHTSFPNASIASSVFADCSKLSSLLIDGVSTIGSNCFQSCFALNNIYLVNIGTLSDNCFIGCKELSNVYYFGNNVPSLTPNTFPGTEGSYFTFHVPRLWTQTNIAILLVSLGGSDRATVKADL